MGVTHLVEFSYTHFVENRIVHFGLKSHKRSSSSIMR
jgi:hypothetical protein